MYSPSSFFWPVFWVSICPFPTLTQFLFHSSSASPSQSVPWRVSALPGYLRAASCMLLGLSKESIEIAAKTSCLSSDCSTQIWHWAVIAEKDLLRPLEHVQCRQKGWEIQVQEVLAVHRPQGLKLDIFEWLFIERAKGTRSLPTCKSLF